MLHYMDFQNITCLITAYYRSHLTLITQVYKALHGTSLVKVGLLGWSQWAAPVHNAGSILYNWSGCPPPLQQHVVAALEDDVQCSSEVLVAFQVLCFSMGLEGGHGGMMRNWKKLAGETTMESQPSEKYGGLTRN